MSIVTLQRPSIRSRLSGSFSRPFDGQSLLLKTILLTTTMLGLGSICQAATLEYGFSIEEIQRCTDRNSTLLNSMTALDLSSAKLDKDRLQHTQRKAQLAGLKLDIDQKRAALEPLQEATNSRTQILNQARKALHKKHRKLLLDNQDISQLPDIRAHNKQAIQHRGDVRKTNQQLKYLRSKVRQYNKESKQIIQLARTLSDRTARLNDQIIAFNIGLDRLMKKCKV